MVTAMRTYGVLMLLLCTTMVMPGGYTQEKHFAGIKLSKNLVYVGEPFTVTFSVYTPTWFTKAPDLGDYQVMDAFSYRTGRAQSTYETIEGKRYTTLNFQYQIFPVTPGELELPELEIHFESPPEGDYKGIPITVNIKPEIVIVNSLPENPDGARPFSATSVWINQSWSSSFENLKIGDVMEQTIEIKATGTLPNIIPPFNQNSVAWAGVYPKTPQLEHEYTNSVIFSTRIETYTWLFEKEGDFTIPEREYPWFNLNAKKWEKIKIAPVDFSIAANPDLAVLQTLQDSLQQADAGLYQNSEDSKPVGLFGLSFRQISFILILGAVFIWILFYTLKTIRQFIGKRRAQYINSERYYFSRLKSTLKSGNPSQINHDLYQWLDLLPAESKIRNFKDLDHISGNPTLYNAIILFHSHIFGKQGDLSGFNKKVLLKQLIKTRKHIISKKINNIQ
jgi:hypothetical protein